MDHPKLRGGLNALGWLLSMGVTVSGVVVPAIGYTLLGLMLPVSVWTFWPWLKRIRLRTPFVVSNGGAESSPGYPGQVFTPVSVTRGDATEAIRSRDSEIERLKKEVEQRDRKIRGIAQDYDKLRAILSDPTAKQQLEERALSKRCGDVALAVRDFAIAHPSRYPGDEREAIERFKLRHYDKVKDCRDQLDRRKKLSDKERELLTLRPQAGVAGILEMADVLGRIATNL